MVKALIEDTVKALSYNYERDWGSGTGDSFSIQFYENDCKHYLRNYKLIIKNGLSELGTIDIQIRNIVHSSKKMQGI